MLKTAVHNEVIHAAVHLACRAPSYFNSQPWHIVADGAGVLYLYLDRDRLVDTDSSGRQALLSCGPVLVHLRVATAAAGWAANVDYYPNHCRVTVMRPRHQPPTPTVKWIAVAVDRSPEDGAVMRHAFEEAGGRASGVFAIGVWREDLGGGYPDLHIRPVTTRAGRRLLAEDDADAEDDEPVGLVVIEPSASTQIARLVGPHRHNVRSVRPHGAHRPFLTASPKNEGNSSTAAHRPPSAPAEQTDARPAV